MSGQSLVVGLVVELSGRIEKKYIGKIMMTRISENELSVRCAVRYMIEGVKMTDEI